MGHGTPDPTNTEGATGASRRWRFADRVLDEGSFLVTVRGKPVELKGKPFDVLLHLLNHAGEVVTKEELVAAIWPGRILSDSVLAKCVHEVRSAIADAEQEIIRTVHGYGYRLAGEVTVEASSVSSRGAHLSLCAGDPVPHRRQWILRERLGTGGHGEAWLARHEKTDQARVFKFALEARHIVTLKREITLSRLLHDTSQGRIAAARVTEWNLEEQPYFIEVEHAELGSLVVWAAARGGMAAVPLPTRLEIAAQIAETLASAHAVGVLHKDLKPSNVLVFSGPEQAGGIRIKLSDFGSGSVIHPDQLTRLGITRLGFTKTANEEDALAGTPIYVAPEVIAGQPVSVKADIYALGVIYYQLVVGDLRRTIAPGWELDVDDPLVRADIAHAAAGNPERRLGDAGLLAKGIRTIDERNRQAQLAQIEAKATEAARIRALRVEAQLRRARVAAFGASGLGLLIAAALGVGTYEYKQAIQARDEARSVSEFLTQDLLATANPLFGPASDLSLTAVLNRATRRVDSQLASFPRAVPEVKNALAWGYVFTQHLNQAFTLFEESAAASERIYGRHDLRTLRFLDQLAYVYTTTPTKLALAQTLMEEVGSEFKARLPPSHQYRLGHQRIHGHLLMQLNRYQEAINELSSVAQATVEYWPEEKTSVDSVDDPPAIASWELARALLWASRYSEAEAAAVAAIQRIGDSAPLKDGLDFMIGELHIDLGYALVQLGRYSDADRAFTTATTRLARALGGNHSDLTWLRAYQGLLLVERGHLDAAERYLKAELSKCAQQDCRGSRPLISSYLGLTNMKLNRWKEATAFLESAVQEFRVTHGTSSETTLRTCADLAEAYRQQGNRSASWNVLRSVPDALLTQLPAQHTALAAYSRIKGLLLFDEHKYKEAQSALAQALEIYELRQGKSHWRTIKAHIELQRITDAAANSGL